MEKKETEFQTLTQNLAKVDSDSSSGGNGDENKEVIEKKSQEFQKILETSKEERDWIQRMKVIDRAAAARSILTKKDPSPAKKRFRSNENWKTNKAQEDGTNQNICLVTLNAIYFCSFCSLRSISWKQITRT